MEQRLRVDLNADLGELPGAAGAKLDDEILSQISSASVACGGHAGDAASMQRIAERAMDHGVQLGAHLSYVDRENFGRLAVEIPAEQLTAQLLIQLRALAAACSPAYVKPHGALYHRASIDPQHAGAVIAAIQAYGQPLAVLGAPGSVLLKLAAAAGLQAVPEGFADRAYAADGRLIPREQPGALIQEPEAMLTQALRLLRQGGIGSLCLHGDTPGAVKLVRALRQRLDAEGVKIEPFA